MVCLDPFPIPFGSDSLTNAVPGLKRQFQVGMKSRQRPWVKAG